MRETPTHADHWSIEYLSLEFVLDLVLGAWNFRNVSEVMESLLEQIADCIEVLIKFIP